MAEVSPILNVPLEILQYIFDYLPDTDLPNLRLVSRDMSTAVFDMFAENYLETLYCFFPNPKRLLRLKALSSTPHLVRKIRAVKFCLVALESTDLCDIPTVPNKPDGAMSWECHLKKAQEGDFERYLAQEQNLHFEPSDQSLLSSIFLDLAKTECVKVSLFLHGLHEPDTKLFTNNAAVVSGILNTPGLPSLHNLFVECVDWRLEDAVKVLQHSQQTLRAVVLDSCGLIGEATPWTEVFEGLLACPNLEYLVCAQLFDTSVLFLTAQLVGASGECVLEREAEGHHDVQRALEENIVYGLPYDSE
ncbi:hypothetical protein B0A55_09423 [Lecanosticta acicola]|uniref:F-box domain-containing protein n=1 Tax=Lecanosticta acicola TaxID=111012 RepID=A0AAI8Z4K5_9PEZI|nr:hypothetical protein B0A55_09423 [Lecanosticta acicola]